VIVRNYSRQRLGLRAALYRFDHDARRSARRTFVHRTFATRNSGIVREFPGSVVVSNRSPSARTFFAYFAKFRMFRG
jgi:hypothetical protein